MSVAGRTITCNDGTTIALHSSVTPSCVRFALVPQGADYALICDNPNLTGLWWRADENGRGTWVSHQGDTIFAVDYAYDAAGAPRWLTMIAQKRDAGTYTGDVYATNGPSLQSTTFDPHGVASAYLGTGSIVHEDPTHVRINLHDGSSRVLAKQQFGPLPTCTFGTVTDLSTLTNYTDLWWNPSEAGWGINLAHQGDTIFAAWYTYGMDGTPLFLVVAADKTVPGTYSGDLYQAVGPAGPAIAGNEGRHRDVHLRERQQRNVRLHGAACGNDRRGDPDEGDHARNLHRPGHRLPMKRFRARRKREPGRQRKRPGELPGLSRRHPPWGIRPPECCSPACPSGPGSLQS